MKIFTNNGRFLLKQNSLLFINNFGIISRNFCQLNINQFEHKDKDTEKKYPTLLFGSYDDFLKYLTAAKNWEKESTKNCYYKVQCLQNNNNSKCSELEIKNIKTDEIKKNFNSLAKFLHPDISSRDSTNLEIKEASRLQFPKISKAYKVLSNEKSRQDYDESNMSDKEFFSVGLYGGKFRVNILVLFGLSGIQALYYSFNEEIERLIMGENKCPIDHKSKKKIKNKMLNNDDNQKENDLKSHHSDLNNSQSTS